MKLSEAMSKGVGKVPQGRAMIFRLRSGSPSDVCANILVGPGAVDAVALNVEADALGTALVGYYGSVETALRAAYLAPMTDPTLTIHAGPNTLIENLWPCLLSREHLWQGCDCDPLDFGMVPTLRRLIEHEVDRHGRTAENIAAILAAVGL